MSPKDVIAKLRRLLTLVVSQPMRFDWGSKGSGRNLATVTPVAGEISYSHVDCHGVPLDRKMLDYLSKRDGFFVEVGAFDGIVQSNTKLLEDVYGWTGILIEPSESVHKLLRRNRPHAWCCQCALGTFDQNNTFITGDFEGDLMSSVGGLRRGIQSTYQTLVRSLQSILDERNVQHVNFFSLDVEGYELNVLKGVDFNRTTFDYLLIEIYQKSYQELVDFLDARGYTMVGNLTNYNKITNPHWDGTHNDYLFQRRP